MQFVCGDMAVLVVLFTQRRVESHSNIQAAPATNGDDLAGYIIRILD